MSVTTDDLQPSSRDLKPGRSRRGGGGEAVVSLVGGTGLAGAAINISHAGPTWLTATAAVLGLISAVTVLCGRVSITWYGHTARAADRRHRQHLLDLLETLTDRLAEAVSDVDRRGLRTELAACHKMLMDLRG